MVIEVWTSNVAMSMGVTLVPAVLAKRVRPSGLKTTDSGEGATGMVLTTVEVRTWTSSTPEGLAR
jgi:hypothetical protein